MAHAPQSIFHATHQVLLDLLPEAVAVQLHGFYRRPGRKRHLIISDGTRLPGGPGSPSNRLAQLLRDQLEPKLRASIRSCNERNNQSYLCATHNVQGRYANNSVNPCRQPARHPNGRFLHIEQSIEARRPGGPLNPELLRRALEALWPLPAQEEQPLWARALPAPTGYPLPTEDRPYGLSPWDPWQQAPPADRQAPATELVGVRPAGQGLELPAARTVSW